MAATGRIDPEEWVRGNFALFEAAFTGPAGPATSVAEWVAAARVATGEGEIELAAAFQRHLTARGTGLPSNFALALTPSEVLACKFNPRNSSHPIEVASSQFKKEVARWPRGSVRISGLEKGRLMWSATLEVDGSDPVPCRTPMLARNPAAAVVLLALGADPAAIA